MSEVKASRKVVPGEKLAVIEEFGAGDGTYFEGDVIRSSKIGETVYDLKNRIIKVKPSKTVTNVPKRGDIVVGKVESAQSSVVNMRISLVNEKVNEGGFTGMLMIKQDQGRNGYRGRRRTISKVGDLIRAHVVSNENAIIHLSLEDEKDGVLFAVCSICGSRVRGIGNAVKCFECAYIEDRWLSADFSK